MRKIVLIFVLIILFFASSCSNTDDNIDENVEKVENQTIIESVNKKTPKNKVILLAGEDDCIGYSYAKKLQDNDLETNVTPQKYQEYLTGYNNVFINYRNLLKPNLINSQSNGFVPVKFGNGFIDSNPTTGVTFGPELGMAEYFHLMYKEQNTYIIKFGGTTTRGLNGRWTYQTGSYYQSMIEFFDSSIKELVNDGINFEIVSFCLLEGESDAFSGYDQYSKNLPLVVGSVLERYNEYASNNGMSFINLSTSNYYINYWRIDETKESFAETDERYHYIDTLDLGLTRSQDGLNRRYYDAKSELKLGNIIAKKIVELTDYKLEITSNELEENAFGTQDYFFKYGTKLNCLADGNVAESLWDISSEGNKIKVNVQVKDDFVTEGDGIELSVTSAERSKEFVDDSLNIEIHLNGRSVFRCKDGVFKETASLNINPEIRLIKQGENVKGYNVSFELESPFKKSAFSLSLTNKNNSINRSVYSELSTDENKPYTYMSLENGQLLASKYTQYGQSFGNAGNLIAKDVWCLDYDNGTTDSFIYMTSSTPDNEIYLYKSNDINLYVEMDLTATEVHNNDLWPKFGIKMTTEDGSGLFFYVDAWGNGSSMYGVNLGYVTYKTGALNYDWTDLGPFLTNANEYQNASSVKLAILREVDVYKFYCNDYLIATLKDPCKIGATKAYFGVASYNTSMIVKNYRLLYGDELVDFLK